MNEKSRSGGRLYTFGPFRLDAGERRLYREGELVPLPRKVFDLLLILVQNAGRLKTREELIATLWPKTVVEEQGLSTRVYALRRTLGDEGETSAYIETVRGVGYRFIAPVAVEGSEAAAALPSAAAASRSRLAPSRRLWAGIGIVLVLCAVAAGVLAWHFLARPVGGTTIGTSTPSIAVLPFENLSADPANAYFAAGIQDEILTRLAAIGSLKVIARTSTAQYASRPADLRTVGRQLGVTTVLEGSVQKAGDEVHINVQLIDTHTYAHIWAQSYNRKLTHIFNVEGDVAAEIAGALQAKLMPAQSARLGLSPTINSQAYLDFLKANYTAYQVLGSASAKEPSATAQLAIALYRRAVALDPRFALAWARLSLFESKLWWFGLDYTPQRIAAAEEAARRALALDPRLAEAHMAMGYIDYYYREDYAAALTQFEQARRSLPNDADVIAAIAFIHRRQGKWQEALAGLREATELDIRNPYRRYETGITLTELRRYDEAGQQFEQALAIEPRDYTVMSYRVRLLFLAGRPQAARRALVQIPADVDPQGSISALRFWSAWLAHKPSQALAALAHAPDWVMDAVMLASVPTALLRGEAQTMQGDRAAARQSWEEARTSLQAALRRNPDDPSLWSALGLSEAGLGDDDEAVKDGERAMQLLPVSKDAFYGTVYPAMLAAIYARVNQPEAAVKLLRRLLSIPAGGVVSVPLLQTDPTWDSIRKDPRFQALLK